MKRLLLLSLLFIGAQLLYATHNRTGRISYEQIGEKTIRAVIITYTNASAQPADRDTLTICWGNGETEKVARNNGDGQNLEFGFKRNLYTAEHTYEELGEYIVCMTDPNRNAGILNVNWPNSVQEAFHIQATIQLLDLAVSGANKSPDLLNAPIQLLYAGFPFVYDPEAVDPDGDSIGYELIVPMRGINDPVRNYISPDEVDGNMAGTFKLDELTGVLTWNVPEVIGKYNVAIRFKSYRNGTLIDAFVLDLELLVINEEPPTSTAELEQIANSILVFPNPSNEEWVQVEDQNWIEPLQYQIVDVHGREVQDGFLLDRTSKIEMPDQAAGTYFLLIRYRRRWVSKPFQLF